MSGDGIDKDDERTDETSIFDGITRRGFLAGSAATAVGLGAGMTVEGARAVDGPDSSGNRLNDAYNLRKEVASELLNEDVNTVGTYERFDKLHGTFTKALPHNEYGEVDRDAYEQLDTALEGTDVEEYNDIPLGKGRPLANPIAARAFNLVGADGHENTMPENPPVGSDEAAAEMVELYWRALLRDVPFVNYDESEVAQAAYDELDSLDGYTGPTTKGPKQDLFRADYAGVRKGPFMSQFLIQDVPYWVMRIDSRVTPQTEGVDFMTDESSWLNVRRGDASVVGDETYEDTRRRITTGRDLLTYVHRNIPSQTAINAAFYLLANGYPLDPSFEEALETQNKFVEVGPPFITTLVNGVVDNAKHGTWYHKWLAHRRLRPEKYGGLVHFEKKEGRYPFLNSDLVDSEAVRRTNEKYGTWFLPQGYPEGSPTHPAYPAGHSVFIGASVTVVKAIFDGDATFDRAVYVDEDGTIGGEVDETLTVRGELHKAAANHAFGRDFSGIHYRTDGTEGFLLGEKIALEYLQDEVSATAVDVELTLEGFEGDTITVSEDGITRSDGDLSTQDMPPRGEGRGRGKPR